MCTSRARHVRVALCTTRCRVRVTRASHAALRARRARHAYRVRTSHARHARRVTHVAYARRMRVTCGYSLILAIYSRYTILFLVLLGK